MFHVSDFELPKKLIQSACLAKKVGFIDLEVSFSKDEAIGLVGNKIVIGPQETLEGTYWNIIRIYFGSFPQIHNIDLFSNSKEASAVYFKVQQFLNKVF